MNIFLCHARGKTPGHVLSLPYLETGADFGCPLLSFATLQTLKDIKMPMRICGMISRLLNSPRGCPFSSENLGLNYVVTVAEIDR